MGGKGRKKRKNKIILDRSKIRYFIFKSMVESVMKFIVFEAPQLFNKQAEIIFLK